ncbi:MAG: hypothetical protein J0H43_15205, partial [Actinobacteria bacterium]|nr:hypothetical protein [Actinomycetota bacterium]
MTHSQPPVEPGPRHAQVPPTPPAAPTPPPVSPYAVEQLEAKTPVVAWLVPFAALLAVIGAFLPWFKPEAKAGADSQTFDGLYSWKDGKIGLLAPILLVALAIGIIGLLNGRTPSRFAKGSSHPVVSAARATIIAGVVSAVCVVVAWFMVESQYKFVAPDGTNYSWNGFLSALKDHGVNATLSRGPQAGYFLTAAAAVIAIVAGVLMLVMRPKGTPVGPPTVTG